MGPVLFIIFINDIGCVCNGCTSLKLFADDLKLYSAVSVSGPSLSLQQSIDNLVTWSNDWQLPININKCSILSISKQRPTGTATRTYNLGGSALATNQKVSDLGVHIDGQLSFKCHIGNIVAKAAQRVGIFFRGFSSRNLSLVRKVWSTYIRPLLEFNSNVWSPSTVYLIDLIENVQRHFTKRIRSISHLTYLERLASLDLEPLELRRLKSDLLMYYKILHYLTPLDPSAYFTFHLPPQSSRSTTALLVRSPRASDQLLRSFFYRAIDCWNGLPGHVKDAASTNSFVRQLNRVELFSYLKGSAFKSQFH